VEENGTAGQATDDNIIRPGKDPVPIVQGAENNRYFT
jgi:hypothetical protein